MPHFDSDGVQIAYEVAGEGDPVLLIHGFASTSAINWVSTGWLKMLTEAGRQVIMIDNRGHGDSEKLYDPGSYEAPQMAEDSRRLLDHLAIERADVMGYSMGARITTFLAINRPQRVRSAVIAGMAGNIFKGVETSEVIADALLTENVDGIALPAAKAFRLFADRTGGDRQALAACMRAGRPALSHEALATISCPVLVVAGDDDPIAGPVGPLVDAIPGAAGLTLPGRDHMKAVGDMTYKRGVIAFWGTG
ncbi:MAG: alpha/beta hydrolase [Rhizobiales bacterium]|nr:alpha/beta hydrolase [Hyphomicrobiales bacterium]